jgi:hypothetical protein
VAHQSISTSYDADLSRPGHTCLTTRHHGTGSRSITCDECGWFGGTFTGIWAEKQMSAAWQDHLDGLRS